MSRRNDEMNEGQWSRDGDELRDPAQIIRLLKKAMQDEENIEIQLNDRTRTFFTNFIDHPPEPEEEEEAAPTLEGEAPPPPRKKTVFYEPFSYFKERNRIVIAPVLPAVGNALIRNTNQVHFRFFQGVKSVEGTVAYTSTLTVGGEPALQLTFPTSVMIYRKRRHFRAKVTQEVPVQLRLQREDSLEWHELQLVDISVGGLGFCSPWADATQLPIGEQVHIELITPTLPTLRLNTFVRNHGRATIKDGCPKGLSRTGLQFDVVNESMSQQVEMVVAYVQREILQGIQERKKEPAPQHHGRDEGEDRGEKKAHSLGEEIGRFLGMKKTFHFK